MAFRNIFLGLSGKISHLYGLSFCTFQKLGMNLKIPVVSICTYLLPRLNLMSPYVENSEETL